VANIEGLRNRQSLNPPRGAAISGVISGGLMMIALGLVRYAVPANVSEPSDWLLEPHRRDAVILGLDLVPFCGIAFLWFIGVLRTAMGDEEDRFFATVFFGSGLLFVASMFASAAVTGALIDSTTTGELYYFGRSLSDELMNLFAVKMAAVFIFSSCTIGRRIRIFPSWIAFSGYACGFALLFIIANWRWIALVFPAWMLVLSSQMLVTEFRGAPNAPTGDNESKHSRSRVGIR
jgi:hypothetical protein